MKSVKSYIQSLEIPGANPSNKFQVMGFVRHDDLRHELMGILDTELPDLNTRVVTGNLATVQKDVNEHKHAGIVVLEINNEDEYVEEFIQGLRTGEGAKRNFILIAHGLGHEKILSLLRAGVSDFLTLPLKPEEVKQVVSRLADAQTEAGGPKESNIITFAHASGGMGATTLAVNSAMLLTQASQRKKGAACLLDFDMQYGGASIHLDIPGYSPVVDLIDKPGRLDREMLEGMMMRHSSGLRVLTTPEAPLPVEAINSHVVERLLQIAQKRYQYIVIDMPQTLTLWTDAVFKKSKVIYVVTQLNVPAIRQLKRWLSVIEQENLGDLPIKIVVNRYAALDRLKRDNISIAQASESLGRQIDYMIPNDYDLISYSLDQGMPAVSLQPKAKFSLRMKEMLHDVCEDVEVQQKRLFG